MFATTPDLSSLAYLLLRGDLLRLRAPTARDLLEGLAAGAATAVAQLLPSMGQARRPVLEFGDSYWPPKAGRYDENTGFVEQHSELTKLGLALTYPEVAAWLIGLAQADVPTSKQAVQVARAAHALARVLVGLCRTEEQFFTAWHRLFESNEVQTDGTTRDDIPLAFRLDLATHPGIYRLAAECLLQGDDGLGGSLLIAATFSRFGQSLALVRSDQILAQLSPQLVGVSASFQVAHEQITLVCRGLSGSSIDWSNRIKITQTLRRKHQ